MHIPHAACRAGGLWWWLSWHVLALSILQGMKEGGGKPQGAWTADKSGWIKKGSGGLLGHWKDRYLLLRHAQLLIYENEVSTGDPGQSWNTCFCHLCHPGECPSPLCVVWDKWIEPTKPLVPIMHESLK